MAGTETRAALIVYHEAGMNPSKYYGVYAIICEVNGRAYIGVTTKRFGKRWTEHRNSLSQGKHYNKELQADWTAFGADAFRFEMLFAVPVTPGWTPQHLEVYGKEKEFIRQYAGVRYNVVDELNVNRNWAD